MDKSSLNYDWIDTLRGAAILGVIVVHSLMGDKNIVFHNLLGLGAKGVQLFYMVSALTLFLSYNSRKNQEKNFIFNFYIRRFFRIAPMFYLAILYYLYQDWGVVYPEGDYRTVTNLAVWSHFLFAHGFSPYWENSVVPGGWSVAVEVIFYIMCPFLFTKIKNVNDAFKLYIFSVILGLIVVMFMQRYQLIPDVDTWKSFQYSSFFSQFHVFCFGVVTYFANQSCNKTKVLTFACALIFYLCARAFDYIFNGFYLNIILNNIVTSVFFYVIILFLSKNNLAISVLSFFGKISFSMYLVHFSVIYWIDGLGFKYLYNDITINYFLRFFLILLLTSMVSYFTYLFVENPTRSIGKWIIKYRR